MTDAATAKETLGFQTEARQLLKLMIHSLYSNREIFLRELISNASDACDKLRFEALSDASLLAEDSQLRVRIDVDAEAGTLSISDNGIGMSREEAVRNLGTIARSGTAEFLGQLSGDQKKDAQLIGQFGVGFYSGFIVADRIEVFSRRAGLDAADGVRWESDAGDGFSVETVNKPDRGTTVVLHLKADAKEFAESFRIRSIVKKYSDHIAIPVEMRQPAEGEGDAAVVYEVVNAAKALWTRPRNDISDDEYREFYRHISHDFEAPLAWAHNRVEGKHEYTSLLFVPKRAPFDLYQRDAARGLKLFVQRTFILDDAEQFLPLYLRFVKGVIDSGDLPLNVSREILQESPLITSMRSALSKRVLDLLETLSEDKPEEYASFWDAFGQVLKEGVGEDFANRERIAGLLRFASTQAVDAGQRQALADYVSRMKEGQEAIYYLTGSQLAAVRNSPHLEIFRKHGVEVLLLTDRIDEWLVSYLTEFQGKPLQDVARGDLDLSAWLDKVDNEADKKTDEKNDTEDADLLARLQNALGERVASVRRSRRLTDSPACLVLGEQDMGLQLRQMLQAAGQSVPDSKPILEIQPEHALLKRLAAQDENGTAFNDLALVLFEQAALAGGMALEDPAAFVQRVNRLLQA